MPADEVFGTEGWRATNLQKLALGTYPQVTTVHSPPM